MTARLTELRYSSDRPFLIVECRECLVTMNSGHHYKMEDRSHAEAIAAAHNAEAHAAR